MHGEASSSSVDPADGARNLRRLASSVAVAVAIVLVAIKVAAWFATGSVSLLTAVVDSMVDIAASLVTFAGVRYAERPADAQHRYGHGKGEALAAFVQAMFLIGAACVLASEAVRRLIDPMPINEPVVGIVVLIVSSIVTLALVAFQSHVVRRTRSTAIAADRAHYSADLLVNMSVILALVLGTWTGWTRFDPIFAIVIVAFMLRGGIKIARHAAVTLLDRELSEADRGRIRTVVATFPEARGVHDLRTRNAGDRVFIEFHLELDGHLTIDQGHAIADRIELAVSAVFPCAEVLIHQEPAGIDDQRLDHRLRNAAE